MTTTLRGDGVLFNDGTLQSTAANQIPTMSTKQRGLGYRATAADLAWAASVAPGGTSQAHCATPYGLWQSGTLDVANRYTYPADVTGARAINVTYTNTATTPIFIVVTSHVTGNYAGVVIYVNGVVASMRQGDMDDGGARICAWAVVPPGSSYAVDASISEASGFSRWLEFGER